MKTISFIIIGIIYSLNCLGQHIALSDTVSLALPNGTQALNKDSFAAHVNNKFSRSKIALNTIPKANERSDNKHYYKVDNVLITLVHGERKKPIDHNYLLDTKKGMDAMHRRLQSTQNYSSAINTINNNHVLIIYDEIEGVGYYNFFCNDRTDDLALNGSLQFNITDKDKATKIMDELLKSIEFKK